MDMALRAFLKSLGHTVAALCDRMAEAYQRKMETPTPCCGCQEIYLYKDLVPRTLWGFSSAPFDTWMRYEKGVRSSRYCPTCWVAVSQQYEREFRLACHYKREYVRVEAHNERARQMGREASLTIVQWIATLDHYQWRCAYCGGSYEALEHQRPLIAPDGGTTARNCVPSCQSCNLRKGKRHPDEIMQKETSLSPEAHRRILAEMEALHGKSAPPHRL